MYIKKNYYGTGDAVKKAKSIIEKEQGKVVILYGDVPIIREETIRELVSKSIENEEKATILTARIKNPTGYGRIIRDKNRKILKIIEEKDLEEKQRKITEINTGIYCFDIQTLVNTIDMIKPNNNQNEYYLTDLIGIISEMGETVSGYPVRDNTEILRSK